MAHLRLNKLNSCIFAPCDSSNNETFLVLLDLNQRTMTATFMNLRHATLTTTITKRIATTNAVTATITATYAN